MFVFTTKVMQSQDSNFIAEKDFTNRSTPHRAENTEKHILVGPTRAWHNKHWLPSIFSYYLQNSFSLGVFQSLSWFRSIHFHTLCPGWKHIMFKLAASDR